MLIMLYTVSEIADKNDRIEHLIAEIAKGNKDALGDLYSLIKTDVFAYAMSKTGNKPDAEDIMQDTFIQIYKYAGRYEPQGKPMAWIMTIAKNHCMRKFREYKNRSDLPEEDWERYLESADRVTPEDKMVIEQVMNGLSDEERQIVVLHALSGFKHREIARMLELPLATVLSKYHRALKKLKSHL